MLGRPQSFWLCLHAALHIDGYALHRKLLALRQSAGVPETVSALRVCDVVLGCATMWSIERRAASGSDVSVGAFRMGLGPGRCRRRRSRPGYGRGLRSWPEPG
ncbi:DUF6308 family protein [Streptomyces sp. NPDC003554]